MNTKNICIFGLFGAMMYASKVIMSILPNIHLITFFIMLFTVIYGKDAIYIVYCYVFIDGLFSGFALWWIPYLYIWAIIWFISYKTLSRNSFPMIFAAMGFLFGITFGTMYAPGQAILYRLNWNQIIAWIIAGIPFDIIHAISNLIICSFVPTALKIIDKTQ